MAMNGHIISQRRPEIDGFQLSHPVDHHYDEDVHVLAVDDSFVDRKFIEQLLRISCCKVTAVDSGRRALEFLGLDGDKSSDGVDDLKVDMIMTDYCMPEMTGYELLKKIKESSTFREVPVVIMSSENVLARIDRCLEEGAEDFIVKPVKLSDVIRLKEHTIRDIRGDRNEDKAVNKRKSPEASLLPSSPSSIALPPSPSSDSMSSKSQPLDLSPSPSSPSDLVSPPLPVSDLSPLLLASSLPSTLLPKSSSVPTLSSPSSLESPTRPLKMTDLI